MAYLQQGPSMPSALPIIAQTKQMAFGKSSKADRYTLVERLNVPLKQSGHNVVYL